MSIVARSPILNQLKSQGLKRTNLRSCYEISNDLTRLYSTSTPKCYNFDRMSGGVLGGVSGSGDGTGMSEITRWPITKTNTIINIVPQGKRYVIERFGKMSAIHDSGFFFAVPLIDQISYIVDIRERAIDIVPQSAITRDNVSVEVSGNLFVRFVDPERAAYGARNPLYSVMQVSQYPF